MKHETHAWPHVDTRPSNVVLMGMGEPLANFPAVMPVVEALTDPMRFVSWLDVTTMFGQFTRVLN
jgi:adenine C2-methylase RlmN of 23S rRNA A2503 and tRNA A37